MNRAVLPSQGSHFFHNITSLGVGYLTVEADNEAEAFLDLVRSVGQSDRLLALQLDQVRQGHVPYFE